MHFYIYLMSPRVVHLANDWHFSLCSFLSATVPLFVSPWVEWNVDEEC